MHRGFRRFHPLVVLGRNCPTASRFQTIPASQLIQPVLRYSEFANAIDGNAGTRLEPPAFFDHPRTPVTLNDWCFAAVTARADSVGKLIDRCGMHLNAGEALSK
jgi:hypothetical protein